MIDVLKLGEGEKKKKRGPSFLRMTQVKEGRLGHEWWVGRKRNDYQLC